MSLTGMCCVRSGTPLYCTSDSYLDMTASQQDDKRALCATACELLTGGDVPDELRDQYDRLSEAQKELAEAEFTRGAEQCQCTDICYDDRVTAAERLGLIGITEVRRWTQALCSTVASAWRASLSCSLVACSS